ncbi:aldose 1-epimerase family protein [Actinomadura rupiterrae]|uniref:aldose 1-epimerase family protein n=1 Tax=Actinomadura rupiterrae TaxID=559627 RepID=UPI0020A413DC|nr:aldose 1-epimerase family protein [Actinomadura rupiterrae]MCP2338362.1 aldose 1-epimerase [Actinomadura rupiterrae]
MSEQRPITGDQHVLAAGPYRAVVTESGAGLRSLTHDGLDVVLTHDADKLAPAAFGQLLVPWPNRVDRGRYTFGGESYQLALSEPKFENAIHGLARWAPWRAVQQADDRVTLALDLLGAQGYPFRLAFTVEYVLHAEDGLTVHLSAENTGTRPAPYAHGAHPYLTVGVPIDECTAVLDAERFLPTDDRMIPPGAPVPVDGTDRDLRGGRVLGAREIDNAYTGLARDEHGRAWARLSGGGRTVELWADEAHPWIEVYTAHTIPAGNRRLGLAVEPMTAPPNAFVTGTDLIELAPGARTGGSWGIMAS